MQGVSVHWAACSVHWAACSVQHTVGRGGRWQAGEGLDSWLWKEAWGLGWRCRRQWALLAPVTVPWNYDKHTQRFF